jgi:hypothetical protein
MITTAWELGGGKLTPARTRLCKWAHTLGHGGHFLTKSRRYSTTFGQLRAARTEHREQQRHPDGERDPWGRPIDEAIVLVLETWSYAGTGYATIPAAELALASAAVPATTTGPTSPPESNNPTEGEPMCTRPNPTVGSLPARCSTG